MTHVLHMLAVSVFITSILLSSTNVQARCKSAEELGREPERRAVIIGNWEYKQITSRVKVDAEGDHYQAWSALKGPKKDVKLFEGELRKDKYAFDKVKAYENLGKKEMKQLLKRLEAEVACDDDLLLVYTGHGVMIGGRSYFVPTDAVHYLDSTPKNRANFVPVLVSLEPLASGKGGRMLFFDACRNELPIATKGPMSKGVVMESALGFAAVYASGEGMAALDGGSCGGSVFSCAFHKALQTSCEKHPDDLVSESRAYMSQDVNSSPPQFSNRGNKVVRFCPSRPTLSSTLPSKPAPGGMVLVPAGSFRMGSESGYGNEKPIHEVYVSGFYIDTYEVTVSQYEKCVRAGGCSTPKETHEDGSYNNYGASGRGKHPINGVDWHQAVAYCEWAGKRLPTEAEWEKAARGTDGRKYPWGNEEPSCRYAVMKDGGYGCGEDRTWEVGSKPAGVSPYGAHDMSGNVYEWVSDWYDKDYYASSPRRDPRGPARGSSRVGRGGSWFNAGGGLRGASRFYGKPGDASGVLGFRCVRSLN